MKGIVFRLNHAYRYSMKFSLNLENDTPSDFAFKIIGKDQNLISLILYV